MIPPDLMHQMAQYRRAELLRDAEEYRRAGLPVRMRIRAWIPRFHTASHQSRAGVVGPSTPGPVKVTGRLGHLLHQPWDAAGHPEPLRER